MAIQEPLDPPPGADEPAGPSPAAEQPPQRPAPSPPTAGRAWLRASLIFIAAELVAMTALGAGSEGVWRVYWWALAALGAVLLVAVFLQDRDAPATGRRANAR